MSDSGGDSSSDADSNAETSNTQEESARAIEDTARIFFAFAGCFVFVYFVDRSMQAGYTLDPHVIYSFVILLIFLFTGAKGATNLLDAWSRRR